jgi:hypothetical protein
MPAPHRAIRVDWLAASAERRPAVSGNYSEHKRYANFHRRAPVSLDGERQPHDKGRQAKRFRTYDSLSLAMGLACGLIILPSARPAFEPFL